MKSAYLTPLLALGLGLAATAQAQVLMLDFGPNTTSAATNSPYHAVNTSFTDTTWNVVNSSAVASGGLTYSNGATATGVSLNLGTATGTSNTSPATTLTIPSSSVTFSALGSQVNTTTGIYANNSVATDGVFISGGSSGTFASVGFQIGGLAAGTYDIYITARNTSSSAAYRENVYAGASSSSGNFTYSLGSSGTSGSAVGSAASGYGLATVGYNGTNSSTSWVQATGGNLFGNYVELSVTLSSGQFLNLAVTGQFSEDRGFLNSVEIVNTTAIPEPSTYVLLGGAAALVFAFVRRRRA